MDLINTLSTILIPAASWLKKFVTDYPIVATIITTLSVASSVWTNHKNRAATVFGHSMQAITHLDQRWESNQMKQYRKVASFFLCKKYTNTCITNMSPSDHENEALRAVLNFLETVGCFVRTDAIAQRTAWQLFGSAAELYVEAAHEQLKVYRNSHTTVYSETHYLYLISRVEEDNPNWPFSWLFLRFIAARLTLNASLINRNCIISIPLRLFQLVYSIITARVHCALDLNPLFSKENIKSSLLHESTLQDGFKNTNTLTDFYC